MAYWACICCYDPITPNIFGKVVQVGGVTVCLIFLPGKTVVIFPGSEQFIRDWVEHDFLVLPYEHPQLGTLHLGFWDGMEAVFKEIAPLLVGDIYVGGHSLGAARAALFIALCKLGGVAVKYTALFESPRPGCGTLSNLLPHCTRGYFSSVNLLDPVPEVPLEPFSPPLPATQLGACPTGLDIIDPIDYHSGALIYKAVRSLSFANVEI